SAGLVAVVSAVPLSQFSQRALDANLSDARWAAARVMCHERVVEYFASVHTVIPLRFGTIYIDKKSVGDMLAERAREFRSVIGRLQGMQEWGVLIYCDHPRLIESLASNNPTMNSLLRRAESAPPGESYLLFKQIESVKAKAARDEFATVLGRMRENLELSSEQSVSSSRHERQRNEHGELVARLSFLVQAGRFAQFQSAAERLAESYNSSGFHIELVGPLPPYSFVAESEHASTPGDNSGIAH